MVYPKERKTEILQLLADRTHTIPEFLQRLEELEQLVQEKKSDRESRLILSTIHSAKGLEYDTVYLLDYGSLSVSDYEYAGPSVKVVLEGISPLILPTFCSLLAALILFFIVYYAMDIRARSDSGKGYVAVTDHTLDRDLVTVRLFIFFGTLILYTWCYYFIG